MLAEPISKVQDLSTKGDRSARCFRHGSLVHNLQGVKERSRVSIAHPIRFTIIIRRIIGRLVKVFIRVLKNRSLLKMDDEQTPLVDHGRIATSTKLAYALGHVFNDLTAATWFSYTLIYLQRVASLEPIVAGAFLLLGQVVDAVMTPIFGFLVDRYRNKKLWHIVGSVMVTWSFPVIFGGFARSSSVLAMLLYVTSITIFQTGWAAVQISHLSMIPSLSNSLLARADLTAIRYSAQVGAAMVVFAVTWLVLPSGVDVESIRSLDQQDGHRFRTIVSIVTSLGVTATVLFHLFLKANLLEQTTSPACSTRNKDELHGKSLGTTFERRLSWSVVTILSRVALLYVASRLFITLATVYLPLYTEEIQVGGKQALASVPLASYASSFVAALLLKHINRKCGTKMCYFLGAVIGILAAVVTELVGRNATLVYAIAVLIGTASSITMVTALSVTAELIGSRTERSALVYSIVTFLDKIITGFVVILIERWRCHDKELCPDYDRDTLSVVCASSMILGLVALLSVSRCLTS